MPILHASDRAPLSLANYAFRSMIKNDVQNIEGNLIKPLLAEYNILNQFEGSYIVRALEFRMENYFCERRCMPTDRYTWNAMNRIESPDVGDDISITRDKANFRIRGTFTNSLNLDINWTDSMSTTMNGTYFHSNPHIYESIYFENGGVIVKRWYNWHNGDGSFTSFPQIPDLDEVESFWEIGNVQNLTVNSGGELIWTYSQIHNYDANNQMFPPLLKTTWLCKATRLCSCVPVCRKWRKCMKV